MLDMEYHLPFAAKSLICWVDVFQESFLLSHCFTHTLHPPKNSHQGRGLKSLWSNKRTHTHAQKHIHTQTHMHTHTHMSAHTHTRANTHTYTHTHAHTRTHRHTHAHTHTHTHTHTA